MSVSRDEWAGTERRQNTVVLVDTCCVVGACAHDRPGLHIGAGKCKHARLACRSAGLIDALDQIRLHAEVGAKWRVLVDRRFELVLGGERKAAKITKADE